MSKQNDKWLAHLCTLFYDRVKHVGYMKETLFNILVQKMFICLKQYISNQLLIST
jgi:hypothetical protein